MPAEIPSIDPASDPEMVALVRAKAANSMQSPELANLSRAGATGAPSPDFQGVPATPADQKTYAAGLVNLARNHHLTPYTSARLGQESYKPNYPFAQDDKLAQVGFHYPANYDSLSLADRNQIQGDANQVAGRPAVRASGGPGGWLSALDDSTGGKMGRAIQALKNMQSGRSGPEVAPSNTPSGDSMF